MIHTSTAHIQRPVRFTEAAPDVHTIPDFMATWAEGERASSPTRKEVENMKKLADLALMEATKQERPSRFREDLNPPYNRIPSIREPVQAASIASRRAAPPVIRRKPLNREFSYQRTSQGDFPVTTYQFHCVATSANDVPAVLLFNPALRRSTTTHTFDQFLAPEHDLSWNDLDEAKSQREQNKPLKRAATFGTKKAKFGAGLMKKGLEKLEQKMEGRRGGLH